jgi:hypothetical protein
MKISRVLLLAFLCCSAGLLQAQSFSPQDQLLILVEGNTLSTSAFGFSGKATLYQSTATNVDGTISFTPVTAATQVDVERNSAKDFTNFGNYGTNGFIPPGIYFLHYHRLDTSLGNVRHRLGLSDAPGEETILSTAPSPPVTRTALQFHVAFNDLEAFNEHVSEGCITLTEANFWKLFPPALFDSALSPLAPGSSDSNPLGLAGSTSNILVFVTDVLTPGKQDQQLQLFQQIKGQLKPTDFANGPTLSAFRVQWK